MNPNSTENQGGSWVRRDEPGLALAAVERWGKAPGMQPALAGSALPHALLHTGARGGEAKARKRLGDFWNGVGFQQFRKHLLDALPLNSWAKVCF